jgi:rare lipoprotein A
MLRITSRRRIGLVSVIATLGLLAGCAETQFAVDATKGGKRRGQTASSVKSQSHYRVGQPYQINGVWYYPEVDYGYDQQGVASWYGPGFHGRLTANGEVYDENDVTAAHPTLPLPSLVRVTNLENGRSIAVRLNDRGPFAGGRIIDLSRRSAQMLGIERAGIARVRVQVLESESRQLAALARQGITDVSVLAQADDAATSTPAPQLAAATPTAAVKPAVARAVSPAPVKPVQAKPVQLAQLQEPAPVTMTDAAPASSAPVTAVMSEELPPLPEAAAAPEPQPPAAAAAPAASTVVPQASTVAPAAGTPAPGAQRLELTPAAPAKPQFAWGSGNMAPIVDGPGTKAPQPTAAPLPAPAPVEAVAAHREDGSAVIVPTQTAQIYVQAGAFSQQKNADAMRTKLAGIGPTAISPVQVGAKQLFRVRVGPVGSPEAADQLLKQVVGAGQPDARIVVETGS